MRKGGEGETEEMGERRGGETEGGEVGEAEEMGEQGGGGRGRKTVRERERSERMRKRDLY